MPYCFSWEKAIFYYLFISFVAKEITSLFNLQSRQVKRTPQDSMNESIDYLKNESVSRSQN